MPAPTRRWPPARKSNPVGCRPEPAGRERVTTPPPLLVAGRRPGFGPRPRPQCTCCPAVPQAPIPNLHRPVADTSTTLHFRLAATTPGVCRRSTAAWEEPMTGSPSPSAAARARRSRTRTRNPRRSRHPPASRRPSLPKPSWLRARPTARRTMSSAGAGCWPPSGRRTAYSNNPMTIAEAQAQADRGLQALGAGGAGAGMPGGGTGGTAGTGRGPAGHTRHARAQPLGGIRHHRGRHCQLHHHRRAGAGHRPDDCLDRRPERARIWTPPVRAAGR